MHRSLALLGHLVGHGAYDVRVAGIDDAQRADSEILPAGRAQVNIVPRVVVDSGLGQHGVIFHFTLPEEREIIF